MARTTPTLSVADAHALADSFLEARRVKHLDFRMEADPPTPTPPAPPPAAAPVPAVPDRGFPENTPLEQMNAEQREAYWKHQARKHEDRVKAFGGATPDEITILREKAARADALEHDLMSDKDKAIADARAQERQALMAAAAPKLVSAELRFLLKGRVLNEQGQALNDEQLNERVAATTELLDMSKLLNSSGEVDTAKVAALADTIAPATGTPAPSPTPPPRGPSPSGLGQRPGSSASPSVASGRELYAAKHRSRSSA